MFFPRPNFSHILFVGSIHRQFSLQTMSFREGKGIESKEKAKIPREGKVREDKGMGG